MNEDRKSTQRRNAVLRNGAVSLVALSVALASGWSSAADFVMTATDTGTTSTSFNGLGKWSPAGAPTPGLPPVVNNYFTNGFTIWTPTGGGTAPTFTFAGDTLQLRKADLTTGAANILSLRSANNATIKVASLQAYDGSSLVLANNNITNKLDGTLTVSGTVTLNVARDTRVLDVIGKISGAGNVTIASTSLAGGLAQYSMPGASSLKNDYSGNTTVLNGAILRMNAVDAMPFATTDGDLIVNTGGTFRLNGKNTTIQGLSGGGAVENRNATASILTIQGDGHPPVAPSTDAPNSNFSGGINNGVGGGALSLHKIGNGTRQILSGANSYTGGTGIEGGQLRISGNGDLGTGLVKIYGSDPGTLELDGVGIESNAVDLHGRTGSTAHIDNIAGTNALSGVVTLKDSDTPADTPDNFNLNVAADKLTVNQGLVADATLTGPVNINLTAAAGAEGHLGDTAGFPAGYALDLNAATGSPKNLYSSGSGGTWYLDSRTRGLTDIIVGSQEQKGGVVNGLGGTLVFNNADIDYTGVGRVGSGATLRQGMAGAVDGKVQIDGVLDINGFDTTLPGLDGAVTGSVANTGGVENTLTITGDGDFAGSIDGVIALQMNGVGKTQKLGGLTPGLTDIAVDAGTLELNNAGIDFNTATIGAAGTLKLGAPVLNGAQTVIVDGTLDIGDQASTLAGLNGAATGSVTGNETLTLTGPGSFAGNLNGALALTMDGADGEVQVLSGAGTYTGRTTVSGGTLEIRSSGALGEATGTAEGTLVNGSGVLSLSGGITTGEYLTLAGRGITPIAVTSAGDNTLSGPITLTAGSDRYFDLASTSGTLTVGGNITADNTNGDVSLAFVGPADTVVNGAIDLTAATGEHKVYALDTGSKTLNGAVNLSGAGTDARIGNEDGGDLTVNGDADLSGAGDSAGLRNYGAGALTAKNVDLSGAGTDAYLFNRDDGNLSVTGNLKMNDAGQDSGIQNGYYDSDTGMYVGGSGDLSVAGADMSGAVGDAYIENYGSGAVTVAGADMRGAGAFSQVVNLADGTVTVNGSLSLSAGFFAGVGNLGSGALTVNGDINTAGTPGYAAVANEGGGKLTVNGNIVMTDTGGDATVGNSGSGELIANGDIDMRGTSGAARVGNDGSGTTTVDGKLFGVDEAGARAGTFVIGKDADLTEVGAIGVLAGATIDATAVVGGFHVVDGQTLFGGGTVDGDVIADSDSIIDVGNSIGTLTFTGDLTLNGDSLVKIELDPTGAGSADLLDVQGWLNIADLLADIEFSWSGKLDDRAYVFASYGHWNLGAFDPAAILPTGYHLDYGYRGNQIALVKDIPVPAPLFLMGLGGLALLGSRRLARR